MASNSDQLVPGVDVDFKANMQAQENQRESSGDTTSSQTLEDADNNTTGSSTPPARPFSGIRVRRASTDTGSPYIHKSPTTRNLQDLLSAPPQKIEWARGTTSGTTGGNTAGTTVESPAGTGTRVLPSGQLELPSFVVPGQSLNKDPNMPRGKKSRKKAAAESPPRFPSTFNPANYPGRFPEGDTSVDLAAINLALGSDINGTAPFDIEKSHGAFPSFIFGDRNKPAGSSAALAGGPFEKFAKGAQNQGPSQDRGRATQNQGSSQSQGPPPAPGPRIINFGVPGGNPLAPQTSAALGSRQAEFATTSRSGSLRNSFAESSAAAASRAPVQSSAVDPAQSSSTGPAQSSFVGPTQSSAGPTQSSSANQVNPQDLSTRLSNVNLERIQGGFGGVAFVGSSNMQRTQSNQGMPSPQGNGGNGNGGPGAMSQMPAQVPVNAGQQMDINMLYQKVIELSEILERNREQTQGIVAGAEELATRAAASGAPGDIQEADREISASRIATLTRQSHDLNKANATLLREQKENTRLIGEYETALGQIVEMVRDLSYKKDLERHGSAAEYNARLQREKDEHLETRMDRDKWIGEYNRVVGMLREAFRLRSEEEELPTQVVAGLQTEVRGLRNALGLPEQTFEDETGFPVLKHVQNGAGEP